MADKPDPADASETTPTPAGPRPPAWVGFVTWSALAIVVLVALQLLGVFLQGAALKDTGLDLQYRIGFAFLDNLDKGPLGFELVLAILLAMAPVIVREPTTHRHDVVAQVVLAASAGLALLVIIGGVLGVPTRIHLVHIDREGSNTVTPVLQRVLMTFVVRNVGPALLALVAAVGGVTTRFRPRHTRPAVPDADTPGS
jgi:hypothetical protein